MHPAAKAVQAIEKRVRELAVERPLPFPIEPFEVTRPREPVDLAVILMQVLFGDPGDPESAPYHPLCSCRLAVSLCVAANETNKHGASLTALLEMKLGMVWGSLAEEFRSHSFPAMNSAEHLRRTHAYAHIMDEDTRRCVQCREPSGSARECREHCPDCEKISAIEAAAVLAYHSKYPEPLEV